MNAIREISGTIERLSEISSTIAAAVEEQARQLRRFPATSNRRPRARSRSVPTSATFSGAPAKPARLVAGSLAAKSLAGDGNRLKLEVSKFLNTVRSA